jgi:hypothetical protein
MLADDSADAKPYFYNKRTGESRWDDPTADELLE